MSLARLVPICLILLAGCSHQYTVTMTNGTRVTAANKPQLRNGYYYFKNAAGREVAINELRVKEIAPASMNDERDQFKVPPVAK